MGILDLAKVGRLSLCSLIPFARNALCGQPVVCFSLVAVWTLGLRLQYFAPQSRTHPSIQFINLRPNQLHPVPNPRQNILFWTEVARSFCHIHHNFISSFDLSRQRFYYSRLAGAQSLIISSHEHNERPRPSTGETAGPSMSIQDREDFGRRIILCRQGVCAH